MSSKKYEEGFTRYLTVVLDVPVKNEEELNKCSSYLANLFDGGVEITWESKLLVDMVFDELIDIGISELMLKESQVKIHTVFPTYATGV